MGRGPSAQPPAGQIRHSPDQPGPRQQPAAATFSRPGHDHVRFVPVRV